jgi:hypothetical protein
MRVLSIGFMENKEMMMMMMKLTTYVILKDVSNKFSFLWD